MIVLFSVHYPPNVAFIGCSSHSNVFIITSYIVIRPLVPVLPLNWIYKFKKMFEINRKI